VQAERPAFAIARQFHPDEDAGPRTQQVRAIRKTEKR
jgi:hypothetical protein